MYVLVTTLSLKKALGGNLLTGEFERTIGSAPLGGEISFKFEIASGLPLLANSRFEIFRLSLSEFGVDLRLI